MTDALGVLMAVPVSVIALVGGYCLRHWHRPESRRRGQRTVQSGADRCSALAALRSNATPSSTRQRSAERGRRPDRDPRRRSWLLYRSPAGQVRIEPDTTATSTTPDTENNWPTSSISRIVLAVPEETHPHVGHADRPVPPAPAGRARRH